MNARTQTVVTRWSSILTLAAALLAPAGALADPILYSTSGDLDFPSATLPLVGVTNADPANGLAIGSGAFNWDLNFVTPAGWLGSTPFHVEFQFNNGLPPIDVSGGIHSITYDFDEQVRNPLVTTTATGAQLALYPQVFQDMIAHPDWLHSHSFSTSTAPTAIALSVHVDDPTEVRPVPEPSSLAVFAMVAAGLGWRMRRRGQV